MPSDCGRQRKILIADANCNFVQELSIALCKSGWAVKQVSPESAAEALEQFGASLLLWNVEAPGSSSSWLAHIATLKPQLIVLPMAQRPSRRRPPKNGVLDFIDQSLGVESAVAAIGHCLAMHESAADSKWSAQANSRPELEFLAKVSHELRTPLNAIIGFSELIIRQAGSSLDQTRHQAYVEDIYTSGRHLLDLINDILDFARAGSGKLLLQESEADIAEVMVSVNRLLGPRMRDAGLEYSQNIPANLGRLWCDERKLKRMLLNLLTNAIKFTPSGGRIDVDVSELPPGIVLTVRDTGIGIAEADLPRVLEPFIQVDNAHSRRSEGTGLGLPLVKAMIEIHGGKLILESKANEGTTAKLVFPKGRLMAPVVHDGPKNTKDGCAAEIVA